MYVISVHVGSKLSLRLSWNYSSIFWIVTLFGGSKLEVQGEFCSFYFRAYLTSGATYLNLGQSLHLCPYNVCTSCEGYGETVLLYRLALAITACFATITRIWLIFSDD